jgi:hypothetical protein
MNKIKTKTCSVCKKAFSLKNFYLRRDRMKRISRCKWCNYEASRRSWKKMTPEEKKNRYKEHAKWIREQYKKGNLKAILQHKLNTYKANAKAKKVPFRLTVDYLIHLFNLQHGKCYYSGDPIVVSTRGGLGSRTSLKNSPNHISLDRVVPSKGYVPGNVVWCTWAINTVKNSLTKSEFFKLCRRILNHHGLLSRRIKKEKIHNKCICNAVPLC